MPTHHKIDYLEFPSANFAETQKFFSQMFEWTFQSYGPEYLAFEQSSPDGEPSVVGGFYLSDLASSHSSGSALVIFYSHSLEASEQNVVRAGGSICREISHFPGGRRLHFLDPSNNEFAIWTDLEANGSQCS